MYDVSETKEFWSCLHCIESALFYTKQNPHLEAMGKTTGNVLNTIRLIPQNYTWSIVRKALVREFSEFTSPAHATAALDNVQQEEGEPLKLYVNRYSVILKMVTDMNVVQNTDPSCWMSFLKSINNVDISNKIAKNTTVPCNLEQCIPRAVQTEAQYQFAEGVNLGRKTGPSSLRLVMVQEIDGDEDNPDNTIPRNDCVARNACCICGEIGYYANECTHNINNMRNNEGKKLTWIRKAVNVPIPLQVNNQYQKEL